MRSFDLTFVVPFRNEEEYVSLTLDSLWAQDLRGYTAEILMIDGLSTDQSWKVVEDFIRKNQRQDLAVSLISNPEQKTPAAFNLGIKVAKAPVIGFGGAHTIYPANYFLTGIELLQSQAADVVGGGHTDIISLDNSLLSQAVICLYKSPMGAGVAAYHRRRNPGYVDTVYGGVYRKEVFERVGLFSESLAKNQDNELNARVVSTGHKIFFHPNLSSKYIQKSDLRSFLTRAFRFGFYHPETWRENPSAFRIRHALPVIWVIYLFSLFFVYTFGPQIMLLWSIPVFVYAFFSIISGIYFMVSKSFLVGLVTIPLFAAYHILYGIGTIAGGFHMLRKSFSRVAPGRHG